MRKHCDTCRHSFQEQTNNTKALQLCGNPCRAALVRTYETLAQALSETCCELWEPKHEEDNDHEGDPDHN